MSWLRIDDGFDTHPKLLELTEQQRWRWTRVLVHCARHDTRGRVSASVLREIGLTRIVPKLVAAGLLEDVDGELYVHDWKIYNGATIEEKVTAFLERYPDASSNDVCRAVGGKRELVLAEINRFRTGSQTVPQVVPALVPGNHQNGSPSGTESVHARALPSRPLQEPPSFLPTEAHNAEEGRQDKELGAHRLDPTAELAHLAAGSDDIDFGAA